MLELSIRRKIPNVALADLLNVDPDELGRRRLRALERLAVELKTDPTDELVLALIERWSEGAGGAEPIAPEPAPPEPAPLAQQGREPASSSRPWPALLLILIVIGLGVGIAVLVSALGGDDDKSSPATSAERTAARSTARKPPRPVAPRARLQPLPEVRGASGSARIVGKQLELSLHGLPRSAGGYTAWLYNSIAEAVPVGRFAGGDGSLKAKLPRDPSRYRFIDVSREPPDGNPNHSGVSVLRVPVASLLR